MRSLLTVGLLVAITSIATAPARAQCFGPDNLFGPCCAPTSANLPNFPAITLPGLGVCWTQCAVDSQNPLTVALGAPIFGSCGVYGSPITVTNPAAPTQTLTGLVRMDYSRTWIESSTPGVVPVQVWRFVVKVDLSFAGTPAPPLACPSPTCLPGQQTAFYYGYIDYAASCNASGPTWEAAVVLFHSCDSYIHTPGLSSRPGAFHPGRVFAIVAPHTTAIPFVPSANLFPNGPLIAQSVRDLLPVPGTIACNFEERLSGGVQQRIGFGCLCPIAGNTTRMSANILQGKGTCPDTSGAVSGFSALNVPNTNWVYEIKFSLGCWQPPAASTLYPGQECAFADEGVFTFHEACFVNPNGTTGADFIEIFYGGSTTFGWAPTSLNPAVILSNRFIDMANNYSAPLLGPYPGPAVGNVMASRHIINVNVP